MLSVRFQCALTVLLNKGEKVEWIAFHSDDELLVIGAQEEYAKSSDCYHNPIRWFDSDWKWFQLEIAPLQKDPLQSPSDAMKVFWTSEESDPIGTCDEPFKISIDKWLMGDLFKRFPP